MRSVSTQRAPSPTNPTFSGISSYRTEPDRSHRDKSSISSTSLQEPYQISRTHYDELNKYLASYLAKEPANFRSTARQKLTRLTRQQFQELSTDVFDELIRRKTLDNNQVPFLPVREDFHPKRNQARQKLSTLPLNRFRDLSSDTHYELVRRYPEFKEEPSDISMTSPGSAYDGFPSPDFPTAPSDRDREPPPSGESPPCRSQDDYNPPVVGSRGDDPYGEVGTNEQ